MADMIALLERFAAAWNAHDAEALMDCMADDCVFYSAAGQARRGAEHRGRAAVQAAYAAIWKTYPDAAWNEAKHLVSGDRGVSEWVFTATSAGGKRVEVHGCDLFVFRGGKIAVKDSYRKQQP